MSTPSALEAGFVSVDTADAVATIRFYHPKGNSLPALQLRRLAEAVTSCGQDDAARVVVLRSDGSGPFCGGASFDELRAVSDAAQGKEFFMGFARLILAMRNCPKPIVTRVHGKAVGGGVGVVAASDYAVATANASLRLSELNVGIGPFVVGPVIEKKIGTAAFAALAIDADWRDATWAQTHGLYAEVFATISALDTAVTTLAARLARSNPEAMLHIKRAVWLGTEDWDRLLSERAELSGRLVMSEFSRRAIGEFGKR